MTLFEFFTHALAFVAGAFAILGLLFLAVIFIVDAVIGGRRK